MQQTAALALGRLANYNVDLAEEVVAADILPQLVASLANNNVRESIATLHAPHQLTDLWIELSICTALL